MEKKVELRSRDQSWVGCLWIGIRRSRWVRIGQSLSLNWTEEVMPMPKVKTDVTENGKYLLD
jgi:hypothetical protein